MKKYIWIVIAIIVIIAAIIASSPSNTLVGEKQTVKIGFSLPLSGDLAILGERAKLAAELAKDSFENTKYNYEFIFEGVESILKNSGFPKSVLLEQIETAIKYNSKLKKEHTDKLEELKKVIENMDNDYKVCKLEYDKREVLITWYCKFEEGITPGAKDHRGYFEIVDVK
jgi:hypothetical protein